MRMTASFNAFMTNTVNINKTRLDSLDTSVEAIYEALKADGEIGPLVLGYEPQGSWPHETIIKPAEGVEFDADFMLVMKEQPDWADSPKTYISKVRSALARHGTYGELVQPVKNRCVRVVYAGDYHVDVVPYLALADGRQVIVNGETDGWEDTDPAGFTEWMKGKNDTSGGHLKKVIRLFKYLRDHQDNFKLTRSVLITALLGERVNSANLIADPGYYEDLPTAFFNLVSDLNVWLQANPSMPSIVDPSGATDPQGNPVTFDHRWSPSTYRALRTRIDELAALTKTAYEDNTSFERSLELWQRVFGTDFKLPPSSSGGTSGAGAAGAGAAGLSSVASGRGG
jgi:hypothetical protein